MPKNNRVKAITRLIVTGVLFLNAILTASGHNPIPLDESFIGQVVSDIASLVAIVWAWWKSNNITNKALYWQRRKEEAEVLNAEQTRIIKNKTS